MKREATKREADLNPRWMQFLLDLPFVGVAICDVRNRHWTDLNDRFCTMVGYTRAELQRMNWRDLCHPGDRVAADAAFKQVLARPTPNPRIGIKLVHKDGRIIPVEIDAGIARAGSHKASHIVALVTEAAGAQDLTRGITAQSIFRDGRSPMVVLDAETWAVVDANPAAEQFYGWSLADIRRLGMQVWDVSHADRALVIKRLKEAAAGAVGRVKGVHRIASGELRDVEIYCGPVRIGDRPCVYGIVHDRTESKRAIAARHEAEEKLQAVVEQTITGISIIENGCYSYVNPRMAEIFGYRVGEMIGVQALDLVEPEDRDLVAENIRRRMSGEIDSLQYEYRGRRKDGSSIEVGVHGTIAHIRGQRVIVSVVQDITERIRADRRIKEYIRKLESATLGAVSALSRMVDLRDPYTAGHERRVAGIAAAIGRELGLSDEKVKSIEIAGRVHDIGKISVPSEILSKPARLSHAEYEIVKLHAPNGYDILNTVEFPWPVADMTHQHHERMDGSGYPQGLKGDQILPEARILAVADVIEAMASHRPYRAAIGIEPALAEIESGAGKRYDADVASSALRLFRDKQFAMPA